MGVTNKNRSFEKLIFGHFYTHLIHLSFSIHRQLAVLMKMILESKWYVVTIIILVTEVKASPFIPINNENVATNCLHQQSRFYKIAVLNTTSRVQMNSKWIQSGQSSRLYKNNYEVLTPWCVEGQLLNFSGITKLKTCVRTGNQFNDFTKNNELHEKQIWKKIYVINNGSKPQSLLLINTVMHIVHVLSLIWGCLQI